MTYRKLYFVASLINSFFRILSASPFNTPGNSLLRLSRSALRLHRCRNQTRLMTSVPLRLVSCYRSLRSLLYLQVRRQPRCSAKQTHKQTMMASLRLHLRPKPLKLSSTRLKHKQSLTSRLEGLKPLHSMLQTLGPKPSLNRNL